MYTVKAALLSVTPGNLGVPYLNKLIKTNKLSRKELKLIAVSIFNISCKTSFVVGEGLFAHLSLNCKFMQPLCDLVAIQST